MNILSAKGFLYKLIYHVSLSHEVASKMFVQTAQFSSLIYCYCSPSPIGHLIFGQESPQRSDFHLSIFLLCLPFMQKNQQMQPKTIKWAITIKKKKQLNEPW